MREDFAVFILSHGRANDVKTLSTLNKCGYSGKWYIIIDNEDSQIDEYYKNFNEHIIVFNKYEVSLEMDAFDLSNNRNTVVYARNVCFKVAESLGLDYFLELDDDYVRFEFRVGQGEKLLTYEMLNIDEVINAMIEFLNDSNALCVAFAQGGDLIGGVNGSKFKQRVLRKAMNSFFCKTSRPFKFIGRINEDVNTYTTLGSRGELFFTLTNMDLIQVPTQQQKGGMSESYLDVGTYYKSFYTIMTMPSCVKIATVGDQHARIHHSIVWENCVPKIISGRFKHE